MPVIYKKNVAVLKGLCEVEDAESLLSWLLKHKKGKLNLKQLTHMHSAILQVIMALEPGITIWPEDDAVQSWLRPLLCVDGSLKSSGAGTLKV